MIIRRCYDVDYIERVLKDPAIRPYVIDDGGDEDLNIPATVAAESYYWLVPEVGKERIGYFFFHPINHVTWEVHSAVLPKFRGRSAFSGATGAVQWMFDNTRCLKIKTTSIGTNKAALSLAKRVGFIFEGISRKSFSLNGTLYDEYLLGLTKEDFLCQQQPS